MTVENLKITACQTVQNGQSKLYGDNAGPFPKHHFRWLYPGFRDDDWALQVSFGGPDENARGVWRTRINSDTFSLEYVKEGTFSYIQNNQSYLCQPGDLFIVQLGATSHFRCASDYAVKKTVAIVGSVLPQLLNTLGLSRTNVIRELPSPQTDVLFDQIFALLEQQPENYMRDASVMAYRLLLELSSLGSSKHYPEQLLLILNFLREHCAEDINVEMLSGLFNISTATLFRLFRKYMQSSPIEQVIEFRMQRAKSLLLEQQYSIKDIAQRVGYHNASFFTAEFKRLFAATPRAFRNKHRPD